MRADCFVPINTRTIYELKLCTYFAFRSIVSFIHITTYITLLVRGLPLVSWWVPISQDTSLCTALLQSPMLSFFAVYSACQGGSLRRRLTLLLASNRVTSHWVTCTCFGKPLWSSTVFISHSYVIIFGASLLTLSLRLINHVGYTIGVNKETETS